MAIDNPAKKKATLSLQGCNECALSTLYIANDAEGLSSGERNSLPDGFPKIW